MKLLMDLFRKKQAKKLMNIYRYQPNSDKFNSFICKAKDQSLLEKFFLGKSLSIDCESLELLAYDLGHKGDFPSLLDCVPVFSEKAWILLEPYLKEDIETFPCITESGERYFLVNVISIIDCLDQENSKITFNSVTKRVSRIKSYSFHQNCISDAMCMFKIPETAGLEVYVTEKFKNLVEANLLDGLIFSVI